MNPWLILVAVLAIAGAYAGGEWKGARDEKTRWEAATYQELSASSQAARDQEAKWQGVVDDTVRKHNAKISSIRSKLDTALDGLRSRPERAPAGVPEAAGAACASASGAELSRPDAEFLAREAARADEQRASLAACYSVIDGVRR